MLCDEHYSAPTESIAMTRPAWRDCVSQQLPPELL
jgi:hypothetical protein